MKLKENYYAVERFTFLTWCCNFSIFLTQQECWKFLVTISII